MKIPHQCGASLSFVRPIIASLIGLSGIALAQTAPSESPKPEETIILSPFEVRTERDVGYAAASTLAGGRINTDLKDTPAAISVINRQFLDDLASTSITDSMEWTVNTAPAYDSGLQEAVVGSFRGNNGSYGSRNYFLWYLPSDTYNIERFEFSRGPNGVLFGDGNLGGIATATTKRAYLGRKNLTVATRIDSYGGYRATADISIPAGERLALRINLLDSQLTGWRDHTDLTRYGTSLAGIVKLDQKSNVRFDGEWGRRIKQRYVTVYLDNASYWDGVTEYGGGAALTTTGKGITRIDANANHFVYIPQIPSAGYSNWATFYRTTGPNLAIRLDPRDLPVPGPTLANRRFNLNSPDSTYDLNYYTYSATIDRRFGDNLYAEVGVSHTMSDYDSRLAENSFNQYYIDINRVMPNGLPNPYFGKTYAEVQRNITSNKNTVSELRGLLNYRFETNWLKENISAIVGTRVDKFDFFQGRLVRTNGLPQLTNSANAYFERRYWDAPDGMPMGEVNIPDYTFDYMQTGGSHQRKWIDYAQVATVSKLFKDRLTVFLGGRYDKAYQTQRSWLTGTAFNDPVTGLGVWGATIIPPGATAASAVAGAKSVIEGNAFSRNAGAVYFPLRWLGVFANFSQTFAVPDSGNNLIDGSAPGISRSEGMDGGIRVSLGGSKLYADLRYYSSKQRDMLTGTGAASQINRIWQNIGRTDLSGLAYRDTVDLDLEGYEFEVTANPTRNIRITANYGLPRKAENVNALPGLRGYYAEHLAEWETAAASNTQIATDLAAIQTLLTNNTAFTTANLTWKYRANVYGTYTFTDGEMKGLSFSLGSNFVGPVKIGNAADAFDYRYAQPYYLMTARVGYHLRVKGYPVDLQLNVNNLLDNRDIVDTTYTTWRQGGVTTNPTYYVPGNFRYIDPRQFVFSATVKF